jgi:hypothetical protein
MNRTICVLLAGAALAVPAAALAQPPAAAAPAGPPNPLLSAAPTYASIPMEIDVNKPAAQVWARIGKFCDIGEWLQIAAGCTITAGKDNEVGAVRTVGNEVLVAKTPLSYAYTQTVRNSIRPAGTVPYNLYHGNLEVRPVTATTSRIYYTLMYDNSMLPDDAARARDLETRRTTFMRAMQNMKTLAEGGTLPPPPPRPAAPPAAPPAR